MTTRAAILQSDITRVMRAVKSEGVAAEIDLRTGVVRLFPANHRPAGLDLAIDSAATSGLAPDGEENFQ